MSQIEGEMVTSAGSYNGNQPLPNARHENFARNLAAGMTQAAAYVEAGYRDNDGVAQTANKLAKNGLIAARVEHLQAQVAEKLADAKIDSVRNVWGNANRLIELAMAQGDFRVAGLMIVKQLDCLGLDAPEYCRKAVLGEEAGERKTRPLIDPRIIEALDREGARFNAEQSDGRKVVNGYLDPPSSSFEIVRS